jgi:hypothetical protein
MDPQTHMHSKRKGVLLTLFIAVAAVALVAVGAASYQLGRNSYPVQSSSNTADEGLIEYEDVEVDFADAEFTGSGFCDDIGDAGKEANSGCNVGGCSTGYMHQIKCNNVVIGTEPGTLNPIYSETEVYVSGSCIQTDACKAPISEGAQSCNPGETSAGACGEQGLCAPGQRSVSTCGTDGKWGAATCVADNSCNTTTVTPPESNVVSLANAKIELTSATTEIKLNQDASFDLSFASIAKAHKINELRVRMNWAKSDFAVPSVANLVTVNDANLYELTVAPQPCNEFANSNRDCYRFTIKRKDRGVISGKPGSIAKINLRPIAVTAANQYTRINLGTSNIKGFQGALHSHGRSDKPANANKRFVFGKVKGLRVIVKQ